VQKGAQTVTKRTFPRGGKTPSQAEVLLLLEEQKKLQALVVFLQGKDSDNAKTIARLREDLAAERAVFQAQMDQLRAQLVWLKKQLFGRKSEKIDTAQMLLDLGELDAAQKKLDEATAEIVKQKIEYERDPRRKALARGEAFEHLPVEEKVRIIPEEVKKEPQAWQECEGAGEVFHEVDYKPPHFFRRRIERPKFVKKGRGREESQDAPRVAPAPARLLGKSPLSLGLMTHIVIEKYCFHMPLTRQIRKIAQESGVRLSKQAICDNIKVMSEKLTPLIEVMRKELVSCGYVQMDETPVKYIDAEKQGVAQTGYFWLANNPKGDVMLFWHTGRDTGEVERILDVEGKKYVGILQTDGYSAYKSYAKDLPQVRQVYCWAHMRRSILEAQAESPVEAMKIVKKINELYEVERECDKADARARAAQWPPGVEATQEELKHFERYRARKRKRERKKKARKSMRYLRARMRAFGKGAFPKSKRGEAVTYFNNHEKGLKNIFRHGSVRLDNNSVENAVRPCALGRKNWLFIGHPKAGERAAVMYTLIASSIRHGHNPEEYLKSVLEEIERLPEGADVSHLVPSRWRGAEK
jgi:transposase